MMRSQCDVYYDPAGKRLIYIGEDPDEQHWDQQWGHMLTRHAICRGDSFVVGQTRKSLPVGARVLDAGCGLSHTVWGLQQAGYAAYGVDYAAQTVAIVNQLVPEMDVREADVRHLPFPDDFFDGIWSLGVIEHFPEGYADIVAEMWRALRPGGVAFVTVPAMSPLRRLKARFGGYRRFPGNYDDFYQFILSPENVISQFQAAGWRYVGGSPRGGFKGLKDEAGLLRPLLQRIYDLPHPVARRFRAIANRVLAPLSFHTRYLQFQKPYTAL